jgi:hypothetical protein
MSDARKLLVVPTIRLVPKDPEALHGFARELGWRNTRVIPSDGMTPEESIYTTSKPNTNVHWIEDPRFEIAYLTIAGDEREAVASELRAIREFYSLPEIVRAANRAQELGHKMEAICYLALLAPDDFDRPIFDIFMKYFEDPEEDVRSTAILAVTYLGWREFIEPLTVRAKGDPSATVRKDAETMVSGLQMYPPRSFLTE